MEKNGVVVKTWGEGGGEKYLENKPKHENKTKNKNILENETAGPLPHLTCALYEVEIMCTKLD